MPATKVIARRAAFVFVPAQHLQPDSPVYWFLMRAGMISEFLGDWPASAWRIRADIKESM